MGVASVLPETNPPSEAWKPDRDAGPGGIAVMHKQSLGQLRPPPAGGPATVFLVQEPSHQFAQHPGDSESGKEKIYFVPPGAAAANLKSAPSSTEFPFSWRMAAFILACCFVTSLGLGLGLGLGLKSGAAPPPAAAVPATGAALSPVVLTGTYVGTHAQRDGVHYYA